MHSWGSEWDERFGDDLTEAHYYIINYVKRRTGCYLMSKEKYGTIRYEYIFPPGGGLFYRHWYSRFWIASKLYQLWVSFGWYMTKRAVYSAIQKYPWLADELMQDLASNDKLVGKRVHSKYWRSC